MTAFAKVTSPEFSVDGPVLTKLFRPLPSFNLIGFSEDLQLWQDSLVETTDAACHEATQWVTQLCAQGSTSVLQALLASSTPEPDLVAKRK